MLEKLHRRWKARNQNKSNIDCWKEEVFGRSSSFQRETDIRFDANDYTFEFVRCCCWYKYSAGHQTENFCLRFFFSAPLIFTFYQLLCLVKITRNLSSSQRNSLCTVHTIWPSFSFTPKYVPAQVAVLSRPHLEQKSQWPTILKIWCFYGCLLLMVQKSG